VAYKNSRTARMYNNSKRVEQEEKAKLGDLQQARDTAEE
jgi:hypothetical protein